jgi:hypothetical protein
MSEVQNRRLVYQMRFKGGDQRTAFFAVGATKSVLLWIETASPMESCAALDLVNVQSKRQA